MRQSRSFESAAMDPREISIQGEPLRMTDGLPFLRADREGGLSSMCWLAIFVGAPMTLLDMRRDEDRCGRRLAFWLVVQKKKAFLHLLARDCRESAHDAEGNQNRGKPPKAIHGFRFLDIQRPQPFSIFWQPICVEAVSSTVSATL